MYHVLGNSDVNFATRDAKVGQLLDVGLRFYNTLKPLQDWYNGGPSTYNVGAPGASTAGYPSPTDMASSNNLSLQGGIPIRLSSRYETYEVLNLGYAPIKFEVQVFAWRPGGNYEGANLSAELSSQLGRQVILHRADFGLQSVYWNKDWRVANGTNGFGPASFFDVNMGDYTTCLARCVSYRKPVIIPAGRVHRFRVHYPAVYPIFGEDLADLKYSFKGLVDRCLWMSWESFIGALPQEGFTDPTESSIHTEKPLIAIRCLSHYQARLYYKTNAARIWSAAITHGPGSTVEIAAKTAVNRAEITTRSMNQVQVAGAPIV